jgi:hypothetical protein
MTPKEKAIEIVDSYFTIIDGQVEFKLIKQCALIAVDEILTWFKAHSYSNKNYDAFVFYNEVKREILNL